MTEQVHTCPRCGYSTHRKDAMVRHLGRERRCKPLVADVPLESLKEEYNDFVEKVYKCKQCDKSYSTRSGLSYHSAKCNGNVVESESSRILQEGLERIEQMIAKMAVAQRSVHVHGDHHEHQHQHIHVHLPLNTFGHENKEYISKEFAIECFRRGAFGLLSMMDSIYFNPEHTENHNVRMKSLKNMLVEVYGGDSWICRGFNEAVDEMIGVSRREIIREVSAHPNIEISLDEMVYSMNSLQNLHSSMAKKIKERTKAKLEDRRKNATHVVPLPAGEDA